MSGVVCEEKERLLSTATFLCPPVSDGGEDHFAPPADQGGTRAQNGGRETTDEVYARSPASAHSRLRPGSVWLDLQVNGDEDQYRSGYHALWLLMEPDRG